WARQAQNVTIIRDNWGIPHVYGKTDADAVFGVMYAQAEDDFNRVETNYLNSMGRLAEAVDGRLRRRPELLPLQTPAGEAARDQALRAMDGAHFQRRQHRRRYRE